jgi:arabinose-5-phosphate isomerase
MKHHAPYAVEAAIRVFAVEAASIAALADRLDQAFVQTVEHLLNSPGRVIVCGMGKSGIIGRKIAATLASTGTPSFFMHPGEAYHGDLGMVTRDDSFVAISNSGETDEVLKLLPYLASNGNFLVALTGNSTSTLATAAHCHLDVRVDQEACPLQLAPTSSTTATLAMGDALAVALMEAREFKPENFARFHPGGSLGRRLLSRVQDEMLSESVPAVDESSDVMSVLHTMTVGGLGLCVVHTSNPGFGIVTDGDLRRAIEKFGTDVFSRTAAEIMTQDPATISPDAMMQDALAKMERLHISALLVADGVKLLGVLKR